jgi:hypothetical protein
VAGATLTTLDDILKNLYLPPVIRQLNDEVLVLQRINNAKQNLYGKQAVVPLSITRTAGVAGVPESGALPDPGNQDYDKAVYTLKYVYGRLRVTGPSMELTDNQAGSFLEALKSEMEGLMTDLKKDVARQSYGDGLGYVANCGTGGASTAVTLSSAEAIRKGDVYVGMLVDIGTAGDEDSLVAGEAITDITIATPSITVTSSISTTAGTHFVSRKDARAGATVYEIDGLKKLVSESANTVGGIDATAAGKEYWDNQRDNDNANLTLDSLMTAENKVRIAGGTTTARITSHGMQRRFFNLLQSQVRYTEPLTLKGGFQSLEFQGKPFIADYQAPYGNILHLDEPGLAVFSNKDFHWADNDGSILKWRSGYDEWEAILRRYLQLGAKRRNTQYLQYGFTDSGF